MKGKGRGTEVFLRGIIVCGGLVAKDIAFVSSFIRDRWFYYKSSINHLIKLLNLILYCII